MSDSVALTLQNCMHVLSSTGDKPNYDILRSVCIIRPNEAAMESIPKDPLLDFNLDTLQFLRKNYGLDKPERLEEAINILQDWLNKQDHIVKKDYSVDYLERTIIMSKGSVERAKKKLDKIATCRTLLPRFFEPIYEWNKSPLCDDLINGFLPKMTQDHYRVYIQKNKGTQFSTGFFDYFKYLIMICEYLYSHDYCNGLLAVFDYTDVNLFEVIKAINLVELQQALGIIMEGFGMRMKGMHFITPSKTIDAFLKIFKQALSEKVAERIHIHKSFDSLSEYIPKENLPSEYGGQEKTLLELSVDLEAVLCSNAFLKYLEVMKTACTNENLRRDDKFNEDYLGMPGSFRKLSVD